MSGNVQVFVILIICMKHTYSEVCRVKSISLFENSIDDYISGNKDSLFRVLSKKTEINKSVLKCTFQCTESIKDCKLIKIRLLSMENIKLGTEYNIKFGQENQKALRCGVERLLSDDKLNYECTYGKDLLRRINSREYAMKKIQRNINDILSDLRYLKRNNFSKKTF